MEKVDKGPAVMGALDNMFYIKALGTKKFNCESLLRVVSVVVWAVVVKTLEV